MKTTFEVWTPVTFESVFYATFAEAMRAARRLQAYGFTAYLRTITARSYGDCTDKNTVELSFYGKLHFTSRYTTKWNGKCISYYVSNGRHVN